MRRTSDRCAIRESIAGRPSVSPSGPAVPCPTRSAWARRLRPGLDCHRSERWTAWVRLRAPDSQRLPGVALVLRLAPAQTNRPGAAFRVHVARYIAPVDRDTPPCDSLDLCMRWPKPPKAMPSHRSTFRANQLDAAGPTLSACSICKGSSHLRSNFGDWMVA